MKNLFIIGTTLISMFFLASCGSIQSDAKKAAEYTCQIIDLTQKAMQGDQEAKEEMDELEKELTDFGNEVKEKYNTESEQEEFQKAFEEEMGKCK